MIDDPILLFCIPFAGGSSYSYRELEKYTADFIEVVPVELPGRGRRFSEPLITDIHELARDVGGGIRDRLHRPYALYGHSMGGCIAYLLARRLAQEGMPLPLHLFVSGREGPSAKLKRPNRHLLPREEFVEELKRFEGTPRQVLENEELMTLFEPILRADFQANDTYVHEPGPPLDVPVTVMIGLDDNTTDEEALKWREETLHEISLLRFPGGHFFIFDHSPQMGRIFSRRLQPLRGEGKPVPW